MAGRPADASGGGSSAAAAAVVEGQQIEAFTVHDVVADKRLLCLEAWSSYVLLGLSDGTLLLASQQPRGPGSTAASRQASSTPAGGTPAGGSPRGSTPGGGGTPAAGTPQGGSEAGGSDTEAEGLNREQPWRVVRSLREFGKGRVKQMVVAKERSMLLCLADDGVNAFDLPALRLKGQAGRTRGAALFAWHGPTDTLAVASKRRLLLFKYDGLEFVEQREVSLPDAAACMQLAGGTLYLGLAKRDYVAVDVATGAVTQLFATKGPAAAMVAVSPSEVLLVRDTSCVRYGPDGRPAKRAKPKRGSGGVGVKAGAVALAWSAPPAALGSSGPYVLGLTEQGAEARLLEPLTITDLWQQLPLGLSGGSSSGSGSGSSSGGSGSAATCIVASSTAEDGSLFMAGREGGAVKQLRPVPFAQQARQALDLGEHEEALALAALMPAAQAEERKQLEDHIHLSFGQRLFREGKFDEALLHFGMSALAGPLELLRLFPSLAPPKLLAAAAAEQAEEAKRDGEARRQGGAEPAAAGAAAGAAGEQQEEAGEGAAEPRGEAFVAAVQVLTPYLLSHRSRLAAAAASPPPKPLRGAPGGGGAQQQQQQQQQELVPDPLAAASDAISPSPSSRAAIVQQRLEGSAMAALLDTALLLALLAAPDSGALLRFVQRPNWVDLEAGEAALRSAGRYSELVALYQSKGRHSAALNLLHNLSQQPEQLPAPAQGASAELRGLPGVWAAVKYVCHLPEGQRDLALISTHAKWMLAADPDAGLEMFGNMQPPLAPSSVLPILTTYAPKLAGTYLETALSSGAADPAVYEQELAKIYLERVVGSAAGGTAAGAAAAGAAAAASGSTGAAEAAGAVAAGGAAAGSSTAAAAEAAGVQAGAPRQALPEEYGKLKKLILASRHLDYEALLRVVPQQGLLELRAALLERLGRHTEALRIYVHRLRQLPLAEAYCDRVYARRQQQLREARHAELAAALRRQRSQRDTAAATGAAGGNGYILARPVAAGAVGMPGGSSGGSGSAGSTVRNLPFGGSTGPAGAPATKLQPAPGSSSAEDGADIYLLLVQVLLEEEDGRGGYRPVQHAPDHQVWGDVARLLSRKRDTIQPLKALGLLPGEVPLSSALPFLEGALWGASERRRTAALARNLRRSEHIALLGQLADERQRSVLLTPERNCSICYKRVGTAALVAFPTGLLAHYSCYRRASGSGAAAGGAAAGSGALPVAAAPRRMAAGLAAAAALCLLAAGPTAALTNPDQLQIITAFRDAMLARPGQVNWTKALATWTCPTPANNSVGGTCDPCGQEVWGNWDHMGCRGERIAEDKYRVPGDGIITNIHITDYSIEGEVPIKELCPLKGLREFDVDGGKLTGPIPTEFATCFPIVREIDLSYNFLTGTLPKEIADVAILQQFKVENNRLKGTIPPEYGRMAKLNWLRFADNSFSGPIPDSMAATAPHLYQLLLDGNDFEGDLHMLAEHSFVSFNAADNRKLCGMVPVGLRFAHGFNPFNTGLGLPCPEELLELAALQSGSYKELCSLGGTNTVLRELAQDCRLWRAEWERVYGPPGRLQEAAAKRAGGWKALFASRHATLHEADPWMKPSPFEVQASVDMLAALPPSPSPDSGSAAASAAAASATGDVPAAGEAPDAAMVAGGDGEAEQEAEIEIEPEQEPELCLVFLVDGSGSVTEEDFRVMTDFMLTAVRGVADGGVRAKVAVVQFSNDCRVEQGPTDVDVESFEALMAGMHRMNGGTNIALAVQKAGQLLKPLGPRTQRVLVLLTDGRIDTHQSREAHDMCARLADEQAPVRLHAYGVGRGVDREELLRIISASDAATAEDRYLALMVLDEAPWLRQQPWANPPSSVVSISGVSRNAPCLPGAAPRLAQQRRSQPLSLAGGGGVAARPRSVRCAAGSRSAAALAYRGSAAAARFTAGAARLPVAAPALAFSSIALRGGGTLCFRPVSASMGAAPSSVAAGPSRRPAYGSGSSSNLTRSRRMVLLSAAAPEAPAPPAPDAAGVSVEFDNDSDPQCTVMQLFGRNDTEVLAQVTNMLTALDIAVSSPLTLVTNMLTALDIAVSSANINTGSGEGPVRDIFRITGPKGGKIPPEEWGTLREQLLTALLGSTRSSKPSIFGAVAEADTSTLGSLTSAGDPGALEVAASEMATAAAALVSIERAMLQVTADGGDPAVLAAKQADRAEAASLLERRLAAIEALLTARRQVAAVAVEKVAEPALPDFMKPPPTVRTSGPAAGNGYEIILQGFNWESSKEAWYKKLAAQADEIAEAGFTAIWFPPASDSVSPQGYLPRDLYDLNSKFGSEAELRDAIAVFHEQGIKVVADIVINHRCAHYQGEDGKWNKFGGRLAWDKSAICANNPAFGGGGAMKSTEDYPAAPNIDHAQERIRRDISEWMRYLRQSIGFDGWRFDYVKGYEGRWVREYVDATVPEMAFGEYWDTCSYSDGVLAYSQDAHRQRTVDWCDATGGTSAAFDFTLKGILQEAVSRREYWRLIDSQGRPPGVLGLWPSRAVTFLENHDTGSTLNHWPFPWKHLPEGYCYMLTHCGTPCVFYDHFFDASLKKNILELLAVRKKHGINAKSEVAIRKAYNELYAAVIDKKVAMKIGPADWSPNSDGVQVGQKEWRLVSSGFQYAVWEAVF
ncbi:glycoside hydrolase isoform A [Chlorella sorokiniana]|uniref:alpha-amylase n=1 Tax=Chlorella sorokiniana TaxID=3076 RepID=A0A2P6TII8_CHLSO|nr:glycoside hydrolase isoform A [Chlorella sorokiniana]|eukprot:PRW34079.1 glycoside hydrolase isoform A [Chlorella sorokiniana]